MTPPPLRRDAVQRRLLEMRRLLDVLEQYRDITGDDLEQDIERRLVVERILQQLVDLEQVAAAVPAAVDGYGRYVLTVAGWLDDQGR